MGSISQLWNLENSVKVLYFFKYEICIFFYASAHNLLIWKKYILIYYNFHLNTLRTQTIGIELIFYYFFVTIYYVATYFKINHAKRSKSIIENHSIHTEISKTWKLVLLNQCLLSCISNIFELAINKKVILFLTKYGVTKHQHAFQKN